MNSCAFVGNVVTEPEVRFLNNGTAVLHFRFAVNSGKGEYKKTLFFSASLFGKRAESLQQYIHKGDKLGITGELWQREYEKDGQKRTVHDFNIRDVTLLGSSKSSQPAKEEPYYSDDIPF